MTSHRVSPLFAAILLAGGLSPAFADDAAAPPYGFSSTVGLGVASMPTYLGSPNRVVAAVPLVDLGYRTHDWGSFDLGARGLTWSLEQGDFWGGLVLGVDPGRRQKKPGGLNPIPGDTRLAGMGDVHASADLGVQFGYGPVGIMAHKAVGKRGSEGAQLDLMGKMPFTVAKGFTLTPGITATFADKKYMQAYFGVDAAQAANTSFAPYMPKAGLAKVNAQLDAEYELASNVSLFGSVGVVRLMGDAKKSPLVSKPTGVVASTGVSYKF